MFGSQVLKICRDCIAVGSSSCSVYFVRLQRIPLGCKLRVKGKGSETDL